MPFFSYFYKFLLFLTIFYFDFTFGVIPRACVANVTLSRICCPPASDNGEICGGLRRGACSLVQVHQQQIDISFLVDDRVHWPTKFFNHMCRCYGNFYGIACDECWYGWEGSQCQYRVQRPRIRKNWVQMSRREKDQFQRVLQLSFHIHADYMIMIEQDNLHSDPLRNPIFIPASVHYFMVFLHRFASRTTLYDRRYMCRRYGILDYNHDGSAFVTWHRFFMMFWERQLSQIAKKHLGIDNFAIPYWNYIDGVGCDICHNDMAGAFGSVDKFGYRLNAESVFYNWTEYCSEPTDGAVCFGCHYKGSFGKLTRRLNNNILPTSDDLEFVMSMEKFYVPSEKDGKPCKSFHMAVEGFCGPPGVNLTKLYMHNFVHNSMDGSMCCSASATNDPVFIVLHVEVDRMIEAWLLDNKPVIEDFPTDKVRPGHCRDCNMVGFLPAVRHSDIFGRSSREFGYTYENFEFGKRGLVYGTGQRRPPRMAIRQPDESFAVDDSR